MSVIRDTLPNDATDKWIRIRYYVVLGAVSGAKTRIELCLKPTTVEWSQQLAMSVAEGAARRVSDQLDLSQPTVRVC